MENERLREGAELPADLRRPSYDRAAHGFGIVHLGVGAFHRAHQAVYTEDALESEGGDWRILGISLRRRNAGAALNPQDGLYTLIERGETDGVRVIGAMGPVLGPLGGPGEAQRILETLGAPQTRIVTLTVTEKGYGLDPATGEPDARDPAIAADLAALRGDGLREPRSVPGLVAAALLTRRANGLPPFATVSCDNLADNGVVLRRLVEALVPKEERGFFADCAFPSTMVDRITPAATDATRAEARIALGGLVDEAAVETEPFKQWVLEDAFPAGRPAWEAGGAIFVSDVAPFEAMKLAMLNGAHSLLAYRGQLAGLETVREVVSIPEHRANVRRLMNAAARTLPPVPGIDLDGYADALIARFSNPAIAHRTAQIAMDGTQKLPQRILAPAERALRRGHDVSPFAEALAAWMAYIVLASRKGGPDDPKAEALRTAARESDAVTALRHVLGVNDALWTAGGFGATVEQRFRDLAPART